MKKKILAVGLAASLLFTVPVTGFAQPAFMNSFTDIQGHWAVKDMDQAYQKGIMKGVTKDKFAPNKLVTRAEVAVCLDRVFDLNYNDLGFIKKPVPADFYDDVAAGQWYSEAVLRAGLYNIFNLNERKFDPGRPATRLEVAIAIDKAFHAKQLSVITTQIWPMYKDTTALTQDEQAAVSFMFNTGIMKGRTAGQFVPLGNITRAELAAVLNRTQATLANAKPIETGSKEQPSPGEYSPSKLSFLIQSEERDLNGDGKPEKIVLYQETDPDGMPLAFPLIVNGKKILEPGNEDGFYTIAGFKMQDVDGDGKDELLLFRYNTGSSGAQGLQIFKPDDPNWRELLDVPDLASLGQERFSVKYLGNYQVSFEDYVTGLNLNIPLEKERYQGIENMLEGISTWVDPVSEYEIKDTNSDGICEVTSIQRVIGVSHPDTIALLKTTYQLKQGKYMPQTQIISKENGEILRTSTLSNSESKDN